MKPLAALFLIALVLAPGAQGAAIPWWSTFDASQRLETGRFAARWDVDNAICLGTGTERATRYEKKYRTFDCTAWGKGFENERQLTLRVTGLTTFKVTWLRRQTCTP
jgi:hypothetical protein